MSAIYDYGERKKQEVMKNIAILMIKDNKPDEEIQKYTNLNTEELNELKEEYL